MTLSYYTISDFENMFTNGISYILPSNVKDTIDYLLKELNVTENTSTNYEKTIQTHTEGNSNGNNYKNNKSYNSHDYNKKGNDRRKNKNGNVKEISNEDWEALSSFKSTKIITKEGIDKNINEIRIMLNKISNKNYETQKTAILNEITQFINTEEYENKSNDVEKLTNIVFDIMSSNKFFSELYAGLYKELYLNYESFKTILENKLLDFHLTIDTITYADPNTSYDKYCDYVKINDNRKSVLLFFVNLCKKSVIGIDKIFHILEYFLKKSIDYVDMENRSNELEEITENVFIVVSNIIQNVTDNQYWENTIYPLIITISKMKAKEHKSLSNRAIFKYMDMIDLLDE